MQEIKREALHSSLRNKPIEVQDKFLEVVNTNIRKGCNYSFSVQEANKAVLELEKQIQDKLKLNKEALEVTQVSINKAKILDTFKSIRPLSVEVQEETPEEIDPEVIKGTYFDTNGKLVIEFEDGYKIISKNSLPSNYIEQHVSVSAQYPFFDWIQFNTEANVPLEDRLPGMVTWNDFEDCLEIVQSDDTTLQLGLEQYIQVKNPNGYNLVEGQVVMLSGVAMNEIPTVSPFMASADQEPLYIIGVLTTNLPPNTLGRVTVFGKVRNINTTGSLSGEVWSQGDLLWGHPTIAGQLTNVRPSAPYPAISVAAILSVSATSGIILVRPTIYPRLFYGAFLSNQIQTPLVINTPYEVTFNTTEFSSGVTLQNNSEIVCSNSGLYSFNFKMQVTSNSSSQKNIYIWARLNDIDIPNSATKVTMTGNGVEIAPSWTFLQKMNPMDKFKIMYAGDSTNIVINAPAPTAFCPSAPSVTLKVSKFDL